MGERKEKSARRGAEITVYMGLTRARAALILVPTSHLQRKATPGCGSSRSQAPEAREFAIHEML